MRWLGPFESMNTAYHQLVAVTRHDGIPMLPRGRMCRELRPACFSLDSAAGGLYTGRSRRLNYSFLALEALAYLAGWGDERHALLLSRVNRNVAHWVNPATGKFDGAYGPRLIQSLPGIIDLLERDPDSRQAVASIWEPGTPAPSLDVPCTLSLHFYRVPSMVVAGAAVGTNHLGMTATMRSNDLRWGTPYDVGAFCAIQAVVAGCLGWGLGSYSHVAGSLHVYDDPAVYEDLQFDLTHRGLETWLDTARLPVVGPTVPRLRWEEFVSDACSLLDAAARHCLTRERSLGDLAWAPLDREHDAFWERWLTLVRWRWADHQQVAE